MDARFDPLALLGLGLGDAHVLRNAGGVVTEDVLRSLVVSQRLLGTRRVSLVHHTDCGLHRLDEASLAEDVRRATGEVPPFAFGSFADPFADVERSARLLLESPFLQIEEVSGFVYDTERRELQPVPVPSQGGGDHRPVPVSSQGGAGDPPAAG